ncbi:MAG: class II aldolase/adducin family protein [bacterium]
MSTAERQLREKICLAGRELRQRGLSFGCEGNLSCRLDSNQILITPAGKDKGTLVPVEIVCVSTQGQVRAGELEPSSEWRLHAAAYAVDAGVNAAVHLHPPYATAFAVAERPFATEKFTELAALLGEVPLIPYAPPGSEQLANTVATRLAQGHTFLLARHGLVSFGDDLDQACTRVIAAEHCAQILWLAEALLRPPTKFRSEH